MSSASRRRARPIKGSSGVLVSAFRKTAMGLRASGGQATVEAAFALPVLMVLALLLLQPGIVLYDRIVMQGAAADGCRLLATSPVGDSACEDYIRRRLSAIPQIDQFHVHSGGCTWDIEMEGGEESGEVTVRIATEVRPLPLVDFGAALAGLSNRSGNIVVCAESTARMQPEWVEDSASGRSPSRWVSS